MRQRPSSAPDDDVDDELPADAAQVLPRAERPSKTRLKQQAHELQKLGQALAEMPLPRLDKLDLPDALRQALDDYRRTKSHEGRRRQLQFIGKQMRQADVEPLREAVAAFQLGSAVDTLALHEAERWRTELLAGDEALTRWAQQHPGSDLQRLRNLVRNARKDAAAAPEQRSGRSYRELFQFIKPWLDQRVSQDFALADEDADADDEADGLDDADAHRRHDAYDDLDDHPDDHPDDHLGDAGGDHLADDTADDTADDAADDAAEKAGDARRRVTPTPATATAGRRRR